jgi:hypothetical protein
LKFVGKRLECAEVLILTARTRLHVLTICHYIPAFTYRPANGHPLAGYDGPIDSSMTPVDEDWSPSVRLICAGLGDILL